MNNKAIGGYFELELPKISTFPYPNVLRYQSARSSFYALLEAVKPSKVFVPRFICDTMLAPLRHLNIAYEFYTVTEDLACDFDKELKESELLLYVNYFGICSHYQDALMQRFPKNQLVFDHAQAFFQKPKDVLATIYSPRKFFGVPDGGLLVTKLKVLLPKNKCETSVENAQHLLTRLDSIPEDGYQMYRQSESILDENLQPQKMSTLTEKILFSIDFENVRRIRNQNFQYLHKHLGGRNTLQIKSFDGPLSYPFLKAGKKELREKLIANRIFVPTYWPDAVDKCKDFPEEKLIENILPIPCDQRYDLDDMERVVTLINAALGTEK